MVQDDSRATDVQDNVDEVNIHPSSPTHIKLKNGLGAMTLRKNNYPHSPVVSEEAS